MIKSLMTNWKTSAAGLGVLLITLGNAIQQYSAGGFAGLDLKVLLAGLAAAFSAFAAKDANVSNAPVPAPAAAVPPA